MDMSLTTHIQSNMTLYVTVCISIKICEIKFIEIKSSLLRAVNLTNNDNKLYAVISQYK